jgi:hypothetical protein
MFPDNKIAHGYQSRYADSFGINAAETRSVDEFGSPTHEWSYSTFEQNSDDLFLVIPTASRKRKPQHLQQFKQHCQQIISKLMHQRK